jgi:hypothetical protein
MSSRLLVRGVRRRVRIYGSGVRVRVQGIELRV